MNTLSYSSFSNAERAIKRQGLQLVPHVVRQSREGWLPVFFPLTAEDRSEIVHRGFCVDADRNAPWYPIVGHVYEHYKVGQRYEVLAVGPDSETMQLRVAYKPLYPSEHESFSRLLHGEDEDGKMFGWMDPLPNGTLRFKPVKD